MDYQLKTILIDEKANHDIQALLEELPDLDLKEIIFHQDKSFDRIKQLKPDVVVLNIHHIEERAFDLASKLTTLLPGIVLIVTSPESSPDVIIRSMRAGAREFLTQPLQKNEVLKSVKHILRAKKGVSAERRAGKIIAAFGMKGGVGVTTIVTNLALSLAQKKDVLLLDLNFQLGHVALYLNIQPKYTFLELSNNISDIDLSRLKTTLSRHSSGVHVLTGPTRIEEAEQISAYSIGKALVMLRSLFDYVIIDTNGRFDEITIKALDEADHILAVTDLDIPSAYNTRRCLDLFKRMGYEEDKVKLVLNRYSTMPGLDHDLIEKSLEYPVHFKIPNQSYVDVLKSINQGTPLIQMSPKSKLSNQFFDLAHGFNGAPGPEEPAEKKRKKRLFGKASR